MKGKNVCRMHQGRPIKHGLRSKYRDTIFGERVQELLTDDDLLSIEKQIALLIAVQEKFLEDLSVTNRVGSKDRDQIIRLADSITKNIERVRKVESEQELPQAMQTLVQIVVNVGNDYITDPDKRIAFSKALTSLNLPPAG